MNHSGVSGLRGYDPVIGSADHACSRSGSVSFFRIGQPRAACTHTTRW